MQCVCKKEYCYKRMGTTLKLIAKSSILTSILSEETKCLEYCNLQKSFNHFCNKKWMQENFQFHVSTLQLSTSKDNFLNIVLISLFCVVKLIFVIFDSNCVLNIMSFPLTIFGNSRFRLKVQIQAKWDHINWKVLIHNTLRCIMH